MRITRDLGEKVELWTYNQHNEAERIAAEIKNKIKSQIYGIFKIIKKKI